MPNILLDLFSYCVFFSGEVAFNPGCDRFAKSDITVPYVCDRNILGCSKSMS